jgi:hypothetical protein
MEASNVNAFIISIAIITCAHYAITLTFMLLLEHMDKAHLEGTLYEYTTTLLKKRMDCTPSP